MLALLCGKPCRTRGRKSETLHFPTLATQIDPRSRFKIWRGLGWQRDSTYDMECRLHNIAPSAAAASDCLHVPLRTGTPSPAFELFLLPLVCFCLPLPPMARPGSHARTLNTVSQRWHDDPTPRLECTREGGAIPCNATREGGAIPCNATRALGRALALPKEAEAPMWPPSTTSKTKSLALRAPRGRGVSSPPHFMGEL